MPDVLPTYADCQAAAARIAGAIVRTPLLENVALGQRLGGRVFLKLENLQRTGSFKIRGALNRMLQIPPDLRGQGVVAFSSGNHAQGVAAAAALLGMPATIVMPADAPRIKRENTRALGAAIVDYDRAREDREAVAARILAEKGGTLIKPFDDAAIVAGQGTIGLEIAADAAAAGAHLDAVLAPCSGGGLVSGIALAMAGASPGTKVLSVEPAGYEGMRLSLAAGQRTAARVSTISIADCLMAPMPGEIPFALARRHLSGALGIDDDALRRAVSYAVFALKLVVEPGGSAGLAALLSGVYLLNGKTVAVVLSGGNCDPETVAACCTAFPLHSP